MTRKEASKELAEEFEILKNGISPTDWENPTEELKRIIEANTMAIKVLGQEPYEDTISRQVIKEQMIKYGFSAPDMTVTEFVEDVLPVTPKQKISFDGMTNGEVIGLLFPNAVIHHNPDFMLKEMILPDEWWDEPYKAKSEETE